MKYITLSGKNIENDISTVKDNIKDNNVVFVYAGEGTLYDYIEELHKKGKGLESDDLYRFKICYEKTNLNVTYSSNGGTRSGKFNSMSGLINELDGEDYCKIVIENDDRVQLAFIVQQLIFIDYPLTKVDILLRKEERDADRTKRFMKKVDELSDNCELACRKLQELICNTENVYETPERAERINDIK